MQDHDALYRRMFSHPGMVAQLLSGFVEEKWVEDLDLDAMSRMNGDFIAEHGKRRQADMIWRIPRKSGGDAYLLLMLEFQSPQDRWMALRIMVYAGLLWQHLIETRSLTPDGRLPPVFPVVLYNGDPERKASLNLRDPIALPPDSPLWPWQPAARYHIIDEGRFPDSMLADRGTLADLLFRLENSPEPSQIEGIVDEVIEWFRRHNGFDSLRPLFATLAARVIWTVEGKTLGKRVIEDLLEVKAMLANRPAQWRQQWTAEGERTGERKGEANALLRLLEHRFGPVPETAKQRIDTAGLEELQAWTVRVLDAASIDDVLH